ncbi:MAG: GTPase Era [Clostridia bacterium]|nr:GTPase Era [Clostridia bacterium]MDR3643557.1 GTPase Era [Clostridia bacterium]
MDVKHSGFVAIIGKPNVGKSTLLNAVLGEKIAIVSSKPQTTRNRITGVVTRGGAQLVFLDTPGMHRARTKLGEYMVKTVNESIADVDAAILVVEPEAEQNPAELELLEKIGRRKIPAVLAVNKIDTVRHKEALIQIIASWSRLYDFAAVVPVSAATRDGVDLLLDEVTRLMPEGPQYFPDDTLTDQPERAVAAEIIREKLLMLLNDEIPHGTAVSIDKMHERENSELIDIEAVIYCEKESHKGIIIGKGGEMLKKVGTLARIDIERLIGNKVNLRLWVKVKDDWRNREGVLKTLGYD